MRMLSDIGHPYTTYGVGDHISHYAVNSSVPKTLIRHLLAWCIRRDDLSPDARCALQAALDTPISADLVPSEGSEPAPQAETTVGPYALQDFFLYYVSRFGYRPSKVAYLAEHACGDAASGDDWRAPSDASAAAWLDELSRHVP